MSSSIAGLGIPSGAEVVVSDTNTTLFRVPWTYAAGATELADEHSYLAILLGPGLGSHSAEGFNESRITLLATDLGRAE
jgi:hypothetical protein